MRRLAWPLLGMWGALAVTAIALELSQGRTFEGVLVLTLGLLAGAGALLARRRPGNAVGPVLLLLALVVTCSPVADGVYTRFYDDPTPPLAVVLLVWFDQWVIYVWFGLVGIALPVLFPDGRPPTRWLRALLWVGAGVVVAQVVGTAFGQERIEWGERDGHLANPLAVGGPLGDVVDAIGKAAGIAFGVVLVGSLASVGLRLRRSSGVERQQLKWFAFSVALLLSGLVAALVGELTGYEPLGNVGWTVFLASLLVGVPLAIVVAVLRYRLYDIDLVIKRTLVYGSLTAVLLATYLGLVLLLRLVLSPLAGDSDLAVAGSTLAVAALFRPLRSRVQAVVDRRFYRSRYDATRIANEFGGRLRQEVELQSVTADLCRVVAQTVAPTHVSLWLRSAP